MPGGRGGLLEALPDGVLMCDAEGVLLGVNAAARRLFGEALRPGRSVLGAGVPGLPFDRALRGERLEDMRLVIDTGAGPPRHVSVSATRVLDAEEGQTLAVFIVRELGRGQPLERVAWQQHMALTRANERLRVALTATHVAVTLARRALDGRDPDVAGTLLTIADRNARELVKLIETVLRAGEAPASAPSE